MAKLRILATILAVLGAAGCEKRSKNVSKPVEPVFPEPDASKPGSAPSTDSQKTAPLPGSQPSVVPVVTPPPIRYAVDQVPFVKIFYDGDTWNPAWNRFVSDGIAVHAQLLLENSQVPTSDMNALCPGFYRATTEQKMAFWTLFVGAIAHQESSFIPTARKQEDASLQFKWSLGLLQLSTDDHQTHGAMCDFENGGKDIFSPEDNLKCGIVVLQNQLKLRKELFPTPQYYWAVLDAKKEQVKTIIRSHLPGLPFCQ